MVFDHRQRNGTVQYAYNNSVLFRPANQDVIWLFVMRAPLHYRNSENADLVAAYTADGGYSWHHVEFYSKNNRNSYPTLIEDAPEKWLAVWDSSDDPQIKRSAIRFGRLEVDK